MTIKEVKNLFSERAKKIYVEHAKKNNGLSFHEFCKNIKKMCDERNEGLQCASGFVEDWFSSYDYEF